MTRRLIAKRRSLACRQLVELVTDYLEDTLTPAQRARVEEHLAECDDCDAYLAQMRQVIAMNKRHLDSATERDDAVPPAMLSALLNEYRRLNLLGDCDW